MTAATGGAPLDVDRALKVVGATGADVIGLLGSLADHGDLYLVGSLASGVGTKDSDIDLHVFVDHDPTRSAPMMFFLGTTIVDLQYFERSEPGRACAALSDQAVELPFGACALGAAPDPRRRVWLARWATAVPFDPGCGPLLSGEQRDRVARALVRAAVEDVVVFAALAGVLDRAGRPAAAAWRRAARGMVDLLVLGAGELFDRQKWRWAKARRAAVAGAVLAAADRVRTGAAFEAMASTLALPTVPTTAVRLRPASHQRFPIADREYLLVDGSRLVVAPAAASLEPASLADAEDRLGAGAVAELLAERLLCLEPDPAALDQALT